MRVVDLTNSRFGRLLVIERAEKAKDGHACWLCRCDCGETKIVVGKDLRTGHTKSCGCLGKVNQPVVLGQRFGRLVVLERAENSKRGESRWGCVCACGEIKIVPAYSLKSGESKSCGCLRKEITATTGRNCATHGHSYAGKKPSPTYNSWQSAKQRCFDPNIRHYARYGGIGVTMCNRWKDSFEDFLADMGERPAGTTLGRFGDVGNYEPGNVSWQTRAEQVASRRPDRKYRPKKQLEQIAA